MICNNSRETQGISDHSLFNPHSSSLNAVLSFNVFFAWSENED